MNPFQLNTVLLEATLGFGLDGDTPDEFKARFQLQNKIEQAIDYLGREGQLVFVPPFQLDRALPGEAPEPLLVQAFKLAETKVTPTQFDKQSYQLVEQLNQALQVGLQQIEQKAKEVQAVLTLCAYPLFHLTQIRTTRHYHMQFLAYHCLPTVSHANEDNRRPKRHSRRSRS